MKKNTLWFSHPNQDRSVVNIKILSQLRERLPNLDVRNLDILYQDYQIDIEKEQDVLQKTDRIILLFPIYWVGMPALFSLWREKVFVKDFAYTEPFSQKKSKIFGKELLVIMTLGAPEHSYTKNGFIQEEWFEYTKWIDAMVRFTGMICIGQYSFFDSYITERQNIVPLEKRIQKFVEDIVAYLK